MPNKHLSVPPPPFLSSTSRAEAIEPGRSNDDRRQLSESGHMAKEKNFTRGARIRSGGQTGVDRAALDAAVLMGRP